jgi:hypothetical protein
VRKRVNVRRRSLLITATVLVAYATTAWLRAPRLRADMTERPGNSLDDPIDSPHDLTGLSVKTPRVRVVHTADPAKRGGSMYLQQADPWLGYQWGRDLTQREFRERDGVYGDDNGKLDGPLLPDGASKMMSRSHVNSCGVCHNTPYRDAGAGATIPKNGGEGRNTPHMFGAGLVEMLGQQMRLEAMAVADDNRDGWVSLQEAKGKRLVLRNLPDGVDGMSVEIDYGSFEDQDNNGRPDLNPLFNPIYVDAEGRRIPFAHSLRFEGVAGYTFEVQCFGFGHLYMPFRPPVSTTLRAFTAAPFDIHSGLQAYDPTTLTETTPQGFSLFSNAGAQQCLTAAGRDRGAVRGPTGISKDDPDRDGYMEELSEGDLDVAEWYLLNHPTPGRGKITSEVRRGEQLFGDVGCAACHVADWRLHAWNPSASDYTRQYAGDRRFFDLRVTYNEKSERLEGKLVYLADRENGRTVPRRGAYTIRGLYSDLKYHDVGQKFHQVQFDGSVVKRFRTSPLWGIGSTAPYGHDGASLSLDDVIRRHGGEAMEAGKAYASLGDPGRRAVVAFLESLVLYQSDRLPCDVDGDGKISGHFMVAGKDTGCERFNPEWLFKSPGRIEGPITNVQGERITSCALTNVRDAYGLDLEYLKDTDKDGFPDVIDPLPRQRGYRDGTR